MGEFIKENNNEPSSENPQQESIVADEVKNRDDEIHAAQEDEKARLLEKFFDVPDSGFEVYQNEEKRNNFREDVEFMCRHALATEADVMIFADKAARGYGLLAMKILPVMRLEYSQRAEKDLNEIILPSIMFIDIPGRPIGSVDETDDPKRPHNSEYASYQERRKERDHDYYNELSKKIDKFIKEKKVLFIDESSIDNEPWPDKTEAYNYYQNIWQERQKYKQNEDLKKYNYQRPNHWPRILYFAKMLRERTSVPIKVDWHIGAFGGVGGYDDAINKYSYISYVNEIAYGIKSNDQYPFRYYDFKDKYSEKGLKLYEYEKRYNVGLAERPFVQRSAFEEYEFDNPSSPYSKVFELYGVKNRNDLLKFRKSIRREHSMIAKESLMEVLGKKK